MIEKWLGWCGAWVVVEIGLTTIDRVEEALAMWRSLFPGVSFKGAVEDE